MKNIRLLLPDLFLPQSLAWQVSADLALPFLQKILARARVSVSHSHSHSVEQVLCDAFDVQLQSDVPIAPISAVFDGLGDGAWLRADPVHLALQRDQMRLSQASITVLEAAQFCASLNEYFAGQGMVFFAPHPQRWYVRVETLPDMQTTSLSEVIGANVRGVLPRGLDAPHWHQVFNEIQMLLYANPLNTAREERGELPINSLWLWGGGALARCEKHYDYVASDEVLAEMFAAAAGVNYEKMMDLSLDNRVEKRALSLSENQLLLCTVLRRALQRGDLHVWREALLTFEIRYAKPLWNALRSGKLQRLQLDILAAEDSRSFVLTPADTWKIWRYSQPLMKYSPV